MTAGPGAVRSAACWVEKMAGSWAANLVEDSAANSGTLRVRGGGKAIRLNEKLMTSDIKGVNDVPRHALAPAYCGPNPAGHA